MSIKVIKPREITGKILTLIEESKDEVTIVSPYINISRWTKVKQALIRAKKRGVRIVIYLRADQANTSPEVEPFADSIHLVDRLHAKLYLNSSSAVFTSMNLVQASDEKSTDLGIFTTENSILNSFVEFINTYLKPLSNQSATQSNTVDQPPEKIEPVFHSKLGSSLKNASPNSTWTDANSYWFSRDAAPDGDLMVSETFIWKLRKDIKDTSPNSDWFIQVVQEHFGNEVSISVDNEHKKYTYIRAQPEDKTNQIDMMVRLVNLVHSK